MDTYADLLGTPPDLVLSGEELEKKRNARMQQQAQMQMLAAVQQGADAAQKGTAAVKNIMPQDAEQAEVMRVLQERGGMQ